MTTIGLSYSLVKISTKCAPALFQGGSTRIILQIQELGRGGDRQNAQDDDHDHQFDQGEAGLVALHAHRSVWAWVQLRSRRLRLLPVPDPSPCQDSPRHGVGVQSAYTG